MEVSGGRRRVLARWGCARGGEIVHDSERTRVTRLWFSGCTVIRKEPLGSDAQRRLQHEMAILQRLRGVAGVAQLLDEPRYAGSIVLADAGDGSLAGLSKPLPVKDLVALAVKLAGAVAGIHARGGVTPRHLSGEHRHRRRRDAVSGGFRVGDLGCPDPARVHSGH